MCARARIRACVYMCVCVHLLKHASARVSIVHGVANAGFVYKIIIQFENTITSIQAIVAGEQFNV